MASNRSLSMFDRLLCEVEAGLRVCFMPATTSRPNPADAHPEATLTESERKLSAALIRVDHVGEICAQALYKGQAFTAKNPNTREKLLHAALEERAHLAWCEARLKQLHDRTSYLNAVWHCGAWGIGALTGLMGDMWSLGFVIETERQVESHLEGHLEHLPEQDQRSRSMLEAMQADEAEHAMDAQRAGGQPLPTPICKLMKITSKLMTTIAYWI